MPKIIIQPQNIGAEVPPDLTLLEAGDRAGVDLEAGCFNCSCGTCVARILRGHENLSEPTPEELDVLDEWNKDPDHYRLTCCVKLLKGEVELQQEH